MPRENAHELWPFTSEEARARYLAHYDILEKSWPIEWENRTVHTDHGETFLRIGGSADAPPLVLLPGGQSTSLVWRRLIEPLSKRFRTYALPSLAASDKRVFDSRVDEILLSRECYGPRIPPVRAPALSDAELKSIDVPALYILGEEDGATENPREVLARLGAVAVPRRVEETTGDPHEATRCCNASWAKLLILLPSA